MTYRETSVAKLSINTWGETMGFEKWKDIVRKAKIPEEEWQELIVVKQGEPLGPTILDNFLQKDGDVIEVDLKGKDRRAIGNFMRALGIAKSKRKMENVDFLLRYSTDYRKAYIKRVG